MSHTIVSAKGYIGQLYSLTIVDYTSGTGETVTLQELGLPGIVDVFFTISNSNSLNTPILAVLIGGAIRLFRSTASGLAEVPTTVGLNCVIRALIFLPGL